MTQPSRHPSSPKGTWRWGAAALLLTCAAPAWAGDQPLYQPVPDWVLPTPQADAATGGPTLRTFDIQKRIEHGQIWGYAVTAVRIDSPEGLARAGTVTLQWVPEHGDLIVHFVHILRGGKRIDVLASGAHFTVLRREEKLESQQLNGILTATLSVEGLQVGDILETGSTVTQRDPALMGHASTAAPLLPQPVQMGFGRVRVIWSDADRIHWKTYLSDVSPTESSRPGWHEVLVTLPVAKQPDAAAQAPGRFAHPAILELSDFAGWADVSKTMAPLYRVDVPSAAIKPGGDLDQEVTRIAAASSDPRRRTALALQLVQDKVRYFAVSMNGGNLVPQTPEQTWAMRYGDCKAKTLLLLAVLHRLGVEAEPALANLGNGDLVQERLPSVGAFDHVMVLAHVGGAVLWLDGTALGGREADLDDVPAYRWVLPVRSAGADLLQAPARAPARPVSQVHFDVDMRGGVGMLAPFRATVVVRGSVAGQLNALLANLDAQGRTDVLRKLLATAQQQRIFVQPQFTYDAAADAGTITASGVVLSPWKRGDSRYTFDTTILSAPQYPDRSRAIWQAIPVAMGTPSYKVVEETLRLPRHGAGIAMQGSADLDQTLPGLGSNRIHAELADGVWRLTSQDRKAGGEIAAADIPAMRRQDADFIAKLPRLRTDAGYPAPWQGVEQAKRDHLFDTTIAILDQWIAEKPDEAERYHLRAAFYAEIFERQKAIADYGKALALKGDKATYRERAGLYEALGDKPHALADFKAAHDLDPSDLVSLNRLTRMQAMTGAGHDAVTRIDALLGTESKNEPFYHEMKAVVLAHGGDTPGALAQMDAALEKRSGNAGLLHERCWLKGLLNSDLDNGLADCNRAMQMGGGTGPQVLESRALIYLRQHHPKEAIADLNQAIDLRPGLSFSYFLRALAEREGGDMAAATRDLAAARLLMPAIEEGYAGFGLRW
jgi:tetratricopeptide (TPR) repeat protein/transglutaminase-like putative cysteine protease